MPINQLVKYCDEQYDRDTNGRCADCPHDEGCTSCLQCLEHIHNVNTQSRTYDCPNIAFCYTSKYIFRYSSEVEHLLRRYTSTFRNVSSPIRVGSIGCGPCSELFGLHNFKTTNNLNFEIEYKGFDLKPLWQPIHNKINALFNFNTEFIYDDVFRYYVNSKRLPNILILNYVLSDILRTNRDYFDDFINQLCDLYRRMPNSFLIVNDINLGRNNTEIRFYYDPLIKRLEQENNIRHVGRFHFDTSQLTHYSYGEEYPNNNAIARPAPEIMQRYSSWVECRSAQFVILKTTQP